MMSADEDVEQACTMLSHTSTVRMCLTTLLRRPYMGFGARRKVGRMAYHIGLERSG